LKVQGLHKHPIKRNNRRAMKSESQSEVDKYPPRLLRPDERALVAEWLAAAGDVSSAYVSQRQSDHPAIYRRVVITESNDSGPSYLIDSPTDTDYWIVIRVRPEPEAHRFPTLRDALNSIRLVLPEAA
jgi:hypothetical protein